MQCKYLSSSVGHLASGAFLSKKRKFAPKGYLDSERSKRLSNPLLDYSKSAKILIPDAMFTQHLANCSDAETLAF